MDKNLTDSEIVKALECCNKFLVKHCIDCSFFERDFISCEKRLGMQALDLINRLQAENERLIAEGGNQSTLWSNHFESIYESAKETTKSEAYKEFAERLKELNKTKLILWHEDIDNLLKELIGE